MSAKIRKTAVALMATFAVLTVLHAPAAQAQVHPPKNAVSSMPWV
ncbi:hypothetical protein [Herbidospora mongoliensis]|nr:hypothetical protein [Herbidospora mongoliensis]